MDWCHPDTGGLRVWLSFEDLTAVLVRPHGRKFIGLPTGSQQIDYYKMSRSDHVKQLEDMVGTPGTCTLRRVSFLLSRMTSKCGPSWR